MQGFKRAISETKDNVKNCIVFREKGKATEFISLEYLKTLETMAKRLGSNVTLQHVGPVYQSHVLSPSLNKDMGQRYKNLGPFLILPLLYAHC